MVKYLLITLISLCFMFGCLAPKNFDPSEKMIFTTVRSLQVAKEFRHTGLTAAGKLYRQGMMDLKTKNEIVKIADELQNAINQACDALEIYMILADEDNLASLEDKINIYQKLYGQFANLAIPIVAKNL